MQKKEIMWIAILVALGVIYVHFFTNWFAKETLRITSSRRPGRGDSSVESVVFSLNSPCKLKSLKVVEMKDGKFDPHGHVVWHLVSDSNSAPTQAFAYGFHIHGMKQAPDNQHAEALQPDVVYRLIVSTGSVTGSTDFATQTEPN